MGGAMESFLFIWGTGEIKMKGYDADLVVYDIGGMLIACKEPIPEARSGDWCFYTARGVTPTSYGDAFLAEEIFRTKQWFLGKFLKRI